MTSGTGLAVYDGIQVIDVDTHLTERHDLWTSRAPRCYEDRLNAAKLYNIPLG